MKSEPVLDIAWAQLEETYDLQAAKGMETYGVPLSTFNGRDAGCDAQQELVDAFVYVTQLKMERDAFANECVRLEKRVKDLEELVSWNTPK